VRAVTYPAYSDGTRNGTAQSRLGGAYHGPAQPRTGTQHQAGGNSAEDSQLRVAFLLSVQVHGGAVAGVLGVALAAPIALMCTVIVQLG